MYDKISQFSTAAEFQQQLRALALDLPVDEQILSGEAGSPLAAPLKVGGFRVGNRWCIQPMEGWDGTADGMPSALTLRRWQRFGQSGAKWIWGGEAAAVRRDGRANPRQLIAAPATRSGLAELLETLRAAHRETCGQDDDLMVGLQLTHSGRFAKPNDTRLEPRIAYHHPHLDRRVGIAASDDAPVWTDDQLERLQDDFVAAARVAYEVGFQFVDIKACHGYLLHELLSARERPGRFGGDLAGRSRFLLSVIERIRAETPALAIGVRLSVFDTAPYERQGDVGRPLPAPDSGPYRWGFGVSELDPTQIDLREPRELIQRLVAAGVVALNVSAGSPYYNPHVQRPALYPPSDGYPPPEDPLCGVARQLHAARELKQSFPALPMVGTGYSYLQEFLPHVAQAVVRAGWIDAVGLGRMVLSYPELPQDVLTRAVLLRKKLCRTFSDCTTAPRSGLVSGCYPLDRYYKGLPDYPALQQAKQRLRDPREA